MAFQQNAFQQNAFQIGTPGAGAVSTTIGWFSPLSEPARLKRRPAQYQELFFNPLPVVPFGWYQPLREPKSLAKRGLSVNLQSFFATDIFTEGAAVFASVVSFGGPVFSKPTLYQRQSTYVPLTISFTVPDFGWNQPFSEPVRKRALSTAAQYVGGYSPFVSPTPAISVTSVGPDFSRTVIYPSQSTYVPLTIGGAVVPDYGWYRPLSDPQTLAKRRATDYQDFAYGTLNPVVSFGWAAPFSEPVRTRKMPVAAQYAGGYGTLNPIVSFGWNQPLRDPQTLTRKSFASYQDFTYGTLNPIIPSYGWNQPFAEVTRWASPVARLSPTTYAPPVVTGVASPDLPAISVTYAGPDFSKTVIYQNYSTYVPLDIGVVVVPDYGWFASFRDPVRLKNTFTSLHTSGSIYLTPVFGSTVFSSSASFGGPIFGKPTMYQSQSSYVPLDIPPVVVPDFGWFAAFSNPVKLGKKGIIENLQAFSMQGSVTPIIPSYGWYRPLSDPKDLKPKGLRVELQQSVIQGAVDEIYSFRSTGPLYVNHRSGRPATFWKGRTR